MMSVWYDSLCVVCDVCVMLTVCDTSVVGCVCMYVTGRLVWCVMLTVTRLWCVMCVCETGCLCCDVCARCGMFLLLPSA